MFRFKNKFRYSFCFPATRESQSRKIHTQKMRMEYVKRDEIFIKMNTWKEILMIA